MDLDAELTALREIAAFHNPGTQNKPKPVMPGGVIIRFYTWGVNNTLYANADYRVALSRYNLIKTSKYYTGVCLISDLQGTHTEGIFRLNTSVPVLPIDLEEILY